MRKKLARHRLTRPTALTGMMAMGLILSPGGFIRYNTNVLNEYRSTADVKERQAEYERRHGKHENTL